MTDEEFAAAVQRDAMSAATWFTGPASAIANAIRDRRLLIEAYAKLRTAEQQTEGAAVKFELKFKPEDLIPMPSVIQQRTDETMERVLGKQEQEIKDVLDEHLPAGWTLYDVKARCQMVSVAGNPVQTLCLDGNPILEIHPVEFGEAERRSDSYVQTITQKFRRL